MINQNRLVQTFIDLVQIDSPSEHEEKIAKEMAKRLKNLRLKVEFDSYGNVIAKLPGKGEPFMLNAHLDTVEPGRGIKPKIERDIIKSDGTTILGGDDKTGLAIILEVLTSIKEEASKHLPIEVVLTREEETALGGSLNLDYSKITAKKGLTLDGDEQVHNITISSPSYVKVDATITGRAAHAGMEPEKGISAIKIASDIISQLSLGRIDEETTANIGIIEGGSVRNAVPEKVHFKGEIRSRNRNKLESHINHFQQVVNDTANKYPEAKIELKIYEEFGAYSLKEDHHMIQHVSKVLKGMKIEPNLHHSGGGTDANIFHTHGIEAVVVGTGNYEAHTTREYVVISQMLQAAKLCEKLVTDF